MFRFENLPEGKRKLLCRGYTNPDAAERAQFQIQCVIVFDDPENVWVKGLIRNAPIGHKLWREFVHDLHAIGIRYIHAEREEGRILPRAKLQPDGSWLMEIENLLEKPVDTGFMGL